MFTSREEAGKLLVEKLKQYKGVSDLVILGIPRGGVVVAKIVAQALKVPLDIIIVRKIALPANPELAIGSVGEGKVVYWDEDLCNKLGVDKKQQSLALRAQKLKIKEREKVLRGDRKMADVGGKTVILVDDGVATGATSIAAAKSLKKRGTKKVVLATPVIAKDTLESIKIYFDEIIFLDSPSDFYAVGEFYREFPQVSDEEVIKILSN